MDNLINSKGDEIEIVRGDEEKFVKKLIYLKRFEHSTIWHFALPETAQIKGLFCFCGFTCWPKIQTSNQKLFHTRREKSRDTVCDECAAEYLNAKAELFKQGYI